MRVSLEFLVCGHIKEKVELVQGGPLGNLAFEKKKKRCYLKIRGALWYNVRIHLLQAVHWPVVARSNQEKDEKEDEGEPAMSKCIEFNFSLSTKKTHSCMSSCHSPVCAL